MSQLIQALNSTSTTENGCKTNYSSLDANLDLFFAVGTSRGKDLTPIISKAFSEHPELTIRNILHARDIRGGLGERSTSLTLAKYVLTYLDKENSIALLKAFAEVGRWKDLSELLPHVTANDVCPIILSLWAETALAGHGLAAKWLPVKDKKGAKPFRKAVGMNEAQWRKAIVAVRNTVEQQLCAKQWDSVEYAKIPSLAMKKYYTAFFRNSEERFTDYINCLSKGETKINASTLFPHDIISEYPLSPYGDFNGATITASKEKLLNAQWEALPDYLKGSKENILSVIDTSGSMTGKVAGNTSALDIAVGLGIYCAERTEGIFKNSFITFSGVPELKTISGSLTQKVQQIATAKWGMDTNLELVFSLILTTAVEHSIKESEMPTKILIVSDMEFNGCVKGGRALDMIEKKYSELGYKIPQVVFWSVKSRQGNVPVTVNDKGVALISGFNPAIIPSVLGDDISPKGVMNRALMSDRYDINNYKS